MYKIAALVLMLTGVAVTAFAGPASVPEIDVNSAGAALALVGGAVLVLRGRRKG